MKRKLIVGTIVIVVGICIYAIWDLNQKVGYYQYPSIEDSLDASTLLTECRIPEETLKQMSDEQLAQAVADFPLLMDVYAYSSPGLATEALANKSDAYRELLSRRGAKKALLEKAMELEAESADSITVELLKAVILDEKGFRDTFTEEEIFFLNSK